MTLPEPMREEPIKFAHSVFFRLSLVLVLGIIVAGGSHLYYSTRGWRILTEESEQQLNWNVAADLAARIQPRIKERIDDVELERLLFTLTVSNPKMDFLLLEESGRVFKSVPYRHGLVREEVSLEPIRAALQPKLPSLPLYGDDPFSGSQRIFSVAPITFENRPGYLYVLLLNSATGLTIQNTGQLYLARTLAIGGAISALFAVAVGLILFSFLVRRFRLMSSNIEKFEQGDTAARIPILHHDEFGRLSKTFNRMADTIVANVEQLKVKDKLRRDLVANISHDLRGPVTSMIGYVETLLEKPVSDAERKRCLEAVYENALTQGQLIEDLFHLASLEANEQKPDKDYCDLAKLIENVISASLPQAEKRELKLVRNIPAGLPMVFIDSRMIYRVFSNIVSNAIRYTPSGGKIEVNVVQTERGIRCEIADTGIGIPASDLEFIFDSFFRANKHRPEDPGGTGLGLAIVKRLLALHGSEPRAESRVNEGTRISFELSSKES